MSWVLDPGHHGDISPTQGVLVFLEGEFLQNLTVSSIPDEVEEPPPVPPPQPSDPNNGRQGFLMR